LGSFLARLPIPVTALLNHPRIKCVSAATYSVAA
jgi:hypothetical protein